MKETITTCDYCGEKFAPGVVEFLALKAQHCAGLRAIIDFRVIPAQSKDRSGDICWACQRAAVEGMKAALAARIAKPVPPLEVLVGGKVSVEGIVVAFDGGSNDFKVALAGKYGTFPIYFDPAQLTPLGSAEPARADEPGGEDEIEMARRQVG